MKELIIKNKYLVLISIFIILSIFVSYFYIGYKSELKDDAKEYYEAAKFLQGDAVGGEMRLNRVLTTPLFLYSSIAIDYLTNNLATSFAVVNIIFLFLCIFAFYFLSLEIYKEQRVAFICTLLVVFNYYIFDPGNAHLADMGGWFFYILATLFAIKYFNNSDGKFYYLSIAITAIGVLFKEYGGFSLVNLVLLISFMDLSFKQKTKDILIATFLVLLPLISFHAFIYLKYHYLYTDRFLFVQGTALNGVPKSISLLVKILGWLFSFGWLAFLYGLWEEYKNKDLKRLKILLAILPATLTFYIWPAITQRLGVMFMMWLALIAGYGLSKIKWYLLYPFLGIYIWFNFNIQILINKINLPF